MSQVNAALPAFKRAEQNLINRNITLPRSEYDLRRQRLLEQLPEGSVVILRAATVRYRNNDADYAFRQDSDFYYLTGFAEEDAWLVLTPGHPAGSSNLFCLPKDRAQEVWTGFRSGQEAAKTE